MQAERWRQIEELFHAALQRAPDKQGAWLAEACAGDAELQREVAALLAEHARGGSLLETAASALAADWAQMQEPSLFKRSLGHFNLLAPLGKGGMGEVYLAEDTRLGRKVALKLLPREFASQPDRLSRFKQEARAASALNHPNIVTIYEIDQTADTHFIATEYVEGQTLRALLKQGPLAPAAALDIATQAAGALAAAHSAGVIHRDIKPENIMRRSDGLVKVLDFGLAKLIRPQPATAEASTAQVESAPGMVMGTLAYMSPEQARGQEVDARTDIFSLGAVLYELLRGERAFRGASQTAVLAAILEQEPEPLPAQVPQALAQIVSRCLRKDPARRYQMVAEVQAALEDTRAEFTAGRQIQAPTQQRWAWAALSALLLAALFFAWQQWRAPQNTEPLQAVALTTLPGVEQFPSLSPDGKQVVFAWTDPRTGNQDLYVQMIGQDTRLRLTTDAQSDYNPVWSPDAKWIAFFRSQPPAPTGLRQRELRLIAPLGGLERKLADVRGQDFFPAAAYLAWSAESNALVVTDSAGEGNPNALFVVALESGEKRQLTNPLAPVLADISPALAPDGRVLVFLRRTTWGAGELHLLPLGEGLTAAGEPRRLTSSELRADFPAWMPDGEEIIFAAKSGLWRLAVTGEHEPTRIPYIGEDGLMPVLARAQPGQPTRLVYARNFADSNLWRVETAALGTPATTAPVLAISSTRHEYHCQFSPDGRRVAFISGRSGEQEVWVAEPDGANAIPLTSLRAQESNCPHWSPDGQQIAFSSNAEGEFDVYVIPAAGGKPRRLTKHPAIDFNPTYSRDGQWIYFSSMRSGDFRIWKMPAAGGEETQVTPNQGGGAFELPDGNLYYHMSAVVSPLWRLPLAGGAPVKALDGVVWFNWWPVANGIYFIDQLNGETRLQYLDFRTGKPVTVARNLGEVTAGLTATPDGRTILFSRVDAHADDLMLVENFR